MILWCHCPCLGVGTGLCPVCRVHGGCACRGCVHGGCACRGRVHGGCILRGCILGGCVHGCCLSSAGSLSRRPVHHLHGHACGHGMLSVCFDMPDPHPSPERTGRVMVRVVSAGAVRGSAVSLGTLAWVWLGPLPFQVPQSCPVSYLAAAVASLGE